MSEHSNVKQDTPDEHDDRHCPGHDPKVVPAPTSATIRGGARTTLLNTVSDPALAEDLALSLLKGPDLSQDVLERLARNANALKSRKVKMALVSHPNTPRHVSVPLARQLYTFDLMKVALAPLVPADVKIAVDDILIARLNTVTIGERLTLARRASGRIAAALLLDAEAVRSSVEDKDKNKDKDKDKDNDNEKAETRKRKDVEAVARETRVLRTALENPRLTEAQLIGSVLRPAASAALIDSVARHPKWSSRREVRAALLRTAYLSFARALEFSREMPIPLLSELLASSRLPNKIKDQLLRQTMANAGA